MPEHEADEDDEGREKKRSFSQRSVCASRVTRKPPCTLQTIPARTACFPPSQKRLEKKTKTTEAKARATGWKLARQCEQHTHFFTKRCGASRVKLQRSGTPQANQSRTGCFPTPVDVLGGVGGWADVRVFGRRQLYERNSHAGAALPEVMSSRQSQGGNRFSSAEQTLSTAQRTTARSRCSSLVRRLSPRPSSSHESQTEQYALCCSSLCARRLRMDDVLTEAHLVAGGRSGGSRVASPRRLTNAQQLSGCPRMRHVGGTSTPLGKKNNALADDLATRNMNYPQTPDVRCLFAPGDAVTRTITHGDANSVRLVDPSALGTSTKRL